jgi:hypothetical protein
VRCGDGGWRARQPGNGGLARGAERFSKGSGMMDPSPKSPETPLEVLMRAIANDLKPVRPSPLERFRSHLTSNRWGDASLSLIRSRSMTRSKPLAPSGNFQDDPSYFSGENPIHALAPTLN